MRKIAQANLSGIFVPAGELCRLRRMILELGESFRIRVQNDGELFHY